MGRVITEYNNTVHRTIKQTPAEKYSIIDDEQKIKLNKELESTIKPNKDSKFIIGDRVRISRLKGIFEKESDTNWSREIFTVSKILPTQPVTYKIKDFNNEELIGSFYDQEMQKTEAPEDIYLVEKVLKTKGNKQFVKWLGYPDSANSWITN